MGKEKNSAVMESDVPILLEEYKRLVQPLTRCKELEIISVNWISGDRLDDLNHVVKSLQSGLYDAIDDSFNTMKDDFIVYVVRPAKTPDEYQLRNHQVIIVLLDAFHPSADVEVVKSEICNNWIGNLESKPSIIVQL